MRHVRLLRNSGTYLSAATSVFLVATIAKSGPFDFGGSLEKQLDGSILKSEESIDLSPIRSLTRSLGIVGFDDASTSVRSLLETRGLNPYIGMTRVHSTAENLGLISGSSSLTDVSDYQFQVSSFPICGVTLRTVQHVDGTAVLVGNIPLVDQVGTYSASDWPDQAESSRFAVEGVARHQGLTTSKAQIVKSTRCLMNEQGSLEPVWSFIISLDGLQYDAWATPWRIALASPRFMDATATIRAYDPNQVQGSLKDFSVTVNGDGTMTNDFFTTADYSGSARASSSSNSFVYGTSDTHFAEASTFAYVNQQYDFVKSMGYSWIGAKPIKVITHATIQKTVNNALYTPSDGTSSPLIQVGDGDGVVLKNLPYDADVVSHEFGHHVVYQSITTIAGDSLVLHEGLADFLAMSRTGDSCLGESICPSGSSLCQVASKCLRTADNTLNYTDATYGAMTSAHLKGQLASGFLWDLRKNNSIPGDTLTKYLLQAIPYFPSNANYKSLIAALLYVDQKNSSTYQSVITAAATARGLSPTSLGIDLANLQSSIQSSGSSSSDDSSSSKKGGFLGCGTIGVPGADQAGSVWIVLILFGLPLILRALPKRSLVPVRIKSKPR